MPELAEVETLRRGVDRELLGSAIVAVSATGARSLRRHPDRREFESRVARRRLVSTGRRGKYLILGLDDGQVVVAHMGMSGQLRLAGRDEALARHTHVVLGFAGGTDLRFVDPRTFGEMWVTQLAADGSVAELAGLGIDPLDASAGGLRRLAGVLAGRTTRVKPLLMDQSRIAGIGNMYADEILFESRIHPDRPAGGLSRPEVRRLQEAMVRVLGAAIEHRGSSLADEQYRDLYGRLGEYQKLHHVYGREGDPCPRCATPIKRVVANARSSFFCPRCQLAARRRRLDPPIPVGDRAPSRGAWSTRSA